MVTAFILAITKTGKVRDALGDLLRLNEVKEAHNIYGDYDLLIKVETKDINELNDVLLRKIKSLPYIATTTTVIDM